MVLAKLFVALAATLTAAAQGPAGAPPLPYKLVPDWPQLPAGWNLGETASVAVDQQDNVWVFHRGPHGVIQFDKTGRFLRAWDEPPVISAHGVKVDPEGNVWLVDVAGHAVLKFSPAGRLMMVITNAARAAGDNDSRYAFNRPTAIAFKPNGDFYVSDGYLNSRVIQYTREGDYVRHWGRKGTGDGEFDLVHDVALDRQGRVYVADRTNQRIQVFDAEGRFLNKWTGLGAPWGLAYAARENALYMCDGQNNRVLKLNLDGQVLGAFGSFGKSPGRFDFAHHLAVDSEGSLYVAEIKNWRVQKFAVK